MHSLVFLKKFISVSIICMLIIISTFGCKQKKVFNFRWEVNNSTWIECYTIAGYGVWGGEVDEYHLRKGKIEDLKLMQFDTDHEISDYSVSNDTLKLYKYDRSKIKLDSVVVSLSSFEIIK